MMSENQKEQFEKALSLRYPPNGREEEKFTQGMDMLSKLAEEGYAPAQYDLGMELLLPLMGTPNFKDAYLWFQRAADQNYSEAQVFIGLGLLHGRGVKKDIELGVSYFIKAADQKQAYALIEIASYYREGRYVQQDYKKAHEYYMKAMEIRTIRYEAHYWIGYFYEHGLGCEKNIVEAKKEYQKAKEVLSQRIFHSSESVKKKMWEEKIVAALNKIT